MSGSSLPQNLAIPGDKIARYLLNPDHPQGGSKARFFLGFGFNRERTTEFADALFQQALRASVRMVTPTSPDRRVIACIGPIATPSGREPWIRTVWLVERDEVGRLVTAHPDRARSA